jgi:hypothetical protein
MAPARQVAAVAKRGAEKTKAAVKGVKNAPADIDTYAGQ